MSLISPFLTCAFTVAVASVVPASAASLRAGDIVVASEGGFVVQIDPNTGDRTVLSSYKVGSGPALNAPLDVAIEPSGSVLVTNAGTQSLLRIDPLTGDRSTVSSSTVGTGPNFRTVLGVAVGPGGSVYVDGLATNGTYAIFQVDPANGNRKIVSSESVGTGASFGNLGLLTVAANGQLLAPSSWASGYTGQVFRIDPGTGNRTVVSSSSIGNGTNLMQPIGIAVGSTGAIVVGDNGFGSGSLRGLFSIDPLTGNRDVVSSNSIGTGQSFSSAVLGVDEDAPGSAVVVLEDFGVIRVNLVTGDREVVSSPTVGTGDNFSLLWGLEVVKGVPESSTASLLAIGLLVLVGLGRRRE